MPVAAARTVRVFCRAPHREPDRAKQDLPCQQLLGDLPESWRFVRTAPSLPSKSDGLYFVRCSRCKAWNGFAPGDHGEP